MIPCDKALEEAVRDAGTWCPHSSLNANTHTHEVVEHMKKREMVKGRMLQSAG